MTDAVLCSIIGGIIAIIFRGMEMFYDKENYRKSIGKPTIGELLLKRIRYIACHGKKLKHKH